MDMANLEAILLTALILGSLYAMISIGLSMVWGTLRIFNFAHGSMMTLGAYVTWTLTSSAGLNAGISFAIVLALIFMVLFGMFFERLLIAPFIKRPGATLVTIITTLAGSIFIENSAHIIWTPRMKQLPSFIEGGVNMLGTVIAAQELVVMIAAPLILVALAWFLKYSRLGLAIRGVEQNRDSAQLAGVNVSMVYTITFGLSAGLAALAGIMLGTTRFITPTMGSTPLLKAFIVVILGGLGSMGGTMVSAYIVSLVESISMSFLGLYWTPAVLFGIMILVLVFMPNGLFGKE
ncbi:MAG: branched-chain amino acid ABC transporter permease [Chloroflexota bacterium]